RSPGRGPPAAARTGSRRPVPSDTPGSLRYRRRRGSRTRTCSSLSLLVDVDGHGGADGGGFAHLVGEIVRWVLGPRAEDAVVLALIESRVGRHHAVPGGNAFPLFDGHFHAVLFLG